MAGLIDRIASLAGTELGKAVDLAHRFYQERMGVHNHVGRALIETAAEVAREHPNLVGIGVGLLVEQFLAEQKRRHDVYLAEQQGEAAAGGGKPKAPAGSGAQPKTKGEHPHHDHHLPLIHNDFIEMQLLHPRKVALEVFGALVLLKLSASGLRWFQHDKQHEVWFAPAARIRLWSGTIAAYYLVKSIKSPKLSAWRNGAIALFATDALKPVLQGPKRRGKPAPPRPSTAPVLTAPAASEPAAPQPAPPSTAPTPEAQPPQPTEAPGAH